MTTAIPALSRQPDPSMRTTVVLSVVLHVGVGLWLASSRGVQRPPREVMTISLGGAPGPRNGGLTQMSGQAAPPPPATPAPPRPVAAPLAPPQAARQPAPPPAAAPAVRQAVRPTRRPDRNASTTAAPTTRAIEPAEAVEPGTAPVQTRARGQGFGLSSGGGGTKGVELDVGNFCCPEYLAQMVTLIQRNWQQAQGVTGTTKMVFTIARDGTIDAVSVDRTSGFLALDSAADRSLRLTRQLPPLPAQFSNPSLTVRMYFNYQR